MAEEHEFRLKFTQEGAETIGRSLGDTDKALVDLETRAKRVAAQLGKANKKTEASERQVLSVIETNAKRRAKVAEDTATRLRKLEELRAKRELRSARQRGEDLEALQELQAQRRAKIEERIETARARAREREARAQERQAQASLQLELRNAELRARAIADAHERELALLDVKHRREMASAKKAGADLNKLVEAQARERAELAEKLEGQVAGQVEDTTAEVKDLYEQLGEMGQGLEDALGPMDDMHGAAGKLLGILGGFEDVGKVLSGAAFLEMAQGLLDAIAVVKQAWDDWTGQTEALENDARRREMMLDRLEQAADDYRQALEAVKSAEEGAFGLQGVLNIEQRGQLLDIEKRIRETEKQLAQTLADIDAGAPRGVGADILTRMAQATGQTPAEAVATTRRTAQGLDEQASNALRAGRIELADELRKRAASLRQAADRQAEVAEAPDARRERLERTRERLSFSLGGLRLERDKLIADARKVAQREGIIAPEAPAAGVTTSAGAGTSGSLTAAAALGAGVASVLDPQALISGTVDALDGPARAAFQEVANGVMERLRQARAELTAEMARFHAAQDADRERQAELLEDPNDREETQALLELQRRADAERAIALQRGDDLALLEEVFEKRRLGIVEKYAAARTAAMISERNAQASAIATTAAAAASATKTLGLSKGAQATVDRLVEVANAGKAGAAAFGAAAIGDVAGAASFTAQAIAHGKAAIDFGKVPGAKGGGGGAPSVPSAARATRAAPVAGDLGGAGAGGRRQFSGQVIINNPLLDRRAVRETVGEALSEVGDGQVLIDGEAA